MGQEETINRRDFIRAGAIGATALGLGIQGLACTPQQEELPEREGLKVGLYSITFLGIWYRDRALTLKEVIQRAEEYGYDGVEIDGKRPHGNPLDMPKKRCQDLLSLAHGKGLEIYAISANNDFSSPIPEHRESQIVYLCELIKMTSNLGAKYIRVFLGWPGVTKHPQIARYDIANEIWQNTHFQFTPEEIWDWCREGLIECARFAGDYGITLALQNHKPIIRDYKDVLRMVKEVDSPNLKVCLDAPIMSDKSPENIKRAAQEVGSLQVLSHFGGEYDRDADGKIIDVTPNRTPKGTEYYPHFIGAMKEIGYNGYLGYELCHPLPLVNGETVGLDFAEKNAKLACEFMKGVISTTV